MIKNTPDELVIPKFDIEAANALCDEATNPGLNPRVMLKLAIRVVHDNWDKTFDERLAILEDMAQESLDASKAETEVIERTTQEATHKIIDGAHLFQGYEAPEKPDYFPGA